VAQSCGIGHRGNRCRRPLMRGRASQASREGRSRNCNPRSGSRSSRVIFSREVQRYASGTRDHAHRTLVDPAGSAGSAARVHSRAACRPPPVSPIATRRRSSFIEIGARSHRGPIFDFAATSPKSASCRRSAVIGALLRCRTSCAHATTWDRGFRLWSGRAGRALL
jgi:hypothetical protein